MQGSWFQEIRSSLESIEVLEKAIVSEMLAVQDNPKQRSIAEHRMNNFSLMIQDRAKYVLNFIREQSALKKEEVAIIEGQKGLKPSEKKKPTDVIWQNFYDRAKELRDQFKKQDNVVVQPRNTVEYYRSNVFKPPFKEPDFSSEENKGKYVDMHTIYLEFLNICKVMEESKQSQRLHDYLWFLQNLDKLDDFPMKKKFKHQAKYLPYLQNVYSYLASFIRRSRPLFDIQSLEKSVYSLFQERYAQGKVAGWDDNEPIDESNTQYCKYCKKLYINNEAYVGHLIGKKHKRAEEELGDIPDNPEEEERERARFREENEKRRRNLAFLEFRISKFRQQLASVLYDTMNLVRKKQTRGYEQVQDNEESSSESEQADAPIYNPKNLPLGWDGKPIPYWLYKLHGLGIQYKCEICGNFSYWGRRAFQMHFQEWRHTYGMKCLKIPNTIHFKDITTINDALALHEKLMRESQEAQFRPDIEEEFEDNEGNLLNKKTYLDMKKQGLIG